MQSDTTIINKPGVYLVGYQQLDEPAMDVFLRDHGFTSYSSDAPSDGEYIAEAGGRLCYMSFGAPRPGGNQKYVEHIVESQHGSVLEHATYNFILTGISRSLTHELVRHRAGCAYSQLSQRYVDESDCEFVVPDAIDDPELYAVWYEAIRQARDAYEKLGDMLSERIEKKFPGASKTERRKMARQAARSVLPNATETKIMVTVNARALRHMFVMRGALAADNEIRRLAILMFQSVRSHSPNFFADFEIKTNEDGRVYLETAHVKV